MTYRLGVGVLLLNKSDEVLLGLRKDSITGTSWQMPQGGMNDGETPLEAALRELDEEIGTVNVEFVAESEDWYSYEIPHAIASKLWEGKYIGQKQKWFLMRFLGTDSEINVNTHDPEFSDWKWSDLNSVEGYAVDFKKTLYKTVIAEFGHIITTHNSTKNATGTR